MKLPSRLLDAPSQMRARLRSARSMPRRAAGALATPRVIALLVAVVSIVLVIVGIALIYPPAAVIATGLSLGATLIIDLPERSGGRRA